MTPDPSPAIKCAVCQRATPAPSSTCCARCVYGAPATRPGARPFPGIDGDLEAIVTLTRAAADHVVRGSVPQGGGGKPGSKPPLDVGALDDSQAADALPVLESWERMIREWFSLAPYGPVSALRVSRGATTPSLTLEGVAGFLRSQLPRLVETVDFPIEELAREVREERGRLARYDAGRPDRRPGIDVTCPGEHRDADGRRCGWGLRTDGTGIVGCPACGEQWTPEALLDSASFALLPAAVLVLLSDDPARERARIATWTTRGRMTVHEYVANPNGGTPVPLYRLGEYRAITTRVVGS